MDIIQIETIISQLVQQFGYSAVIASEQQLEESIEALPTAWIQLPTVSYVEGRDEGVIGHKITLRLIDDFRGYSFDDQAARLAEMQEHAIEIMTLLSSYDGVVEVSDMTVSPRAIPTTRHDNIAQICQATVVSYF